MAVSTTASFNLTRDQIIQEALTNIGQFDPESAAAPTATQITQGALRLNALVKAWQADGLQIWKRQLTLVFLQNGQKDYQLGSLGGPGGDNATPVYTSPLSFDGSPNATPSYTITNVPGGANAGAFTITVASTTGMTNGDFIGIQLTTGSLQWTTINGAPAGLVVTLTAALTANVNASAIVYTYRTKAARPIRLLDGYVRNYSGANDSPIRVLSFEEYNRFGQKTSTGQTTQCFLQPMIGYSQLSIYPVPNSVTSYLFCEFHYPFFDFTQASDNPDMPQEWLLAVIWGLSRELGMSYGLTETRLGYVRNEAEYWHQFALGTSQENNVMFQPDPVTAWAWSNEMGR